MMIKLRDIHPHPANPRRDAESVTTLAESINAQGILQAITVAPMPDTDGESWEAPQWIVIDGHRRYAAAKLLDLTEVPCSVRADLTDPADQIGAMLATAREREPLTAAEEAAGVQAMLDLGESIATIATRTGMSKTKVRQRSKVAELPAEILEKIHQHHVTLADAEFLAKYPGYRDELEKKLGTADWAATKERIIKRSERDTRIDKQLREAEKLGVRRLTTHNQYGEIEKLTGFGYNDLDFIVARTWSIEAWDSLPDDQREFAFVRAFDFDNVVSLVIFKRKPAPAADDTSTDSDQTTDADDAPADTEADAAAEAERQEKEAATARRRDELSAATTVRRRFLDDYPTADRETWVTKLLCSGDYTEGWWINYDDDAIGQDTDLDDSDAVEASIHAWLQALTPLDFAWQCAITKTISENDHWLAVDLRGAGTSPASARLALDYIELLTEMGHVLSDVEQDLANRYQVIVDNFEARLAADPALRDAAEARR